MLAAPMGYPGKRLFNLAAAASGIMLCLCVVGCFLARTVDPWKNFISIGSAFHITLERPPPAIAFFNQGDYGPYRGSIISISSATRPSTVETTAFTFPGIYYRHFRWPDGNTLWTLAIGLPHLAVACAVLPLIWVIRNRRCTKIQRSSV